jgi:hypothetical protein
MANRTYHIVVSSLIVAGIIAGGVSWLLDGVPFWIAVGVGAALVIVGLYFAGRTSNGQSDDDSQK